MRKPLFERSENKCFWNWLTKLGSHTIAAAKRRRLKQQSHSDYRALEPRQVLSATFPAFINGELTLGEENSTSPYELSDTFKLESNPDSDKTIYLDFNGHYSTGNAWKHSINFPAYNTSGSSSSFTSSELIEIQKIFQNVAEDFLPLDVNVSTRAPSTSDLVRSSSSDSAYGIRVLVTQYTNGFGNGTGGLAKRNSFMHSVDTPTFVFNKGVNDTSWTISHEVGHTLGLTHDGLNGVDYHPGVGSGETGWGPLMGGPFGKSLTQWSNGDYSGSDNREDDLAVMTRSATGVNLRADDVGNGFSNATRLNVSDNAFSDWGIIGQRQDVDVYRFEVTDSKVSIQVDPFQGYGNLDLIAKLYRADGTLVTSSNPIDSVSASISRSLDAGTYYLSVDGVGRSGRYSDYGSLGFYEIEGSVIPDPVITHSVGEAGQISVVDSNWKTIELTEAYRDPVVIAGPVTSNDQQPAVVRVRNVQSDSFEIRVENWDYLPDEHGGESVSYVVMESGKHTLQDGSTVIAGTGVLSHRHRRVGFGEHFENEPIVFGQVTSDRGGSAVATRVNGVNTGSFGILLQEEENNDAMHVYEQFSWMAIEDIASRSDNAVLETAEIQVSHLLEKVQFEKNFQNAPVVLAASQTKIGDDTAIVRADSINGNEVGLYLDEEQSKDDETTHVKETVGYVALEPGLILALPGESAEADPVSDTSVVSDDSETVSENNPTRDDQIIDAFRSLDLLHQHWSSARLG